MSKLKISVLGPPEVCWDDVPITLPRPRIHALLYRLAVQEDPIPGEHIGFLFWPRKPEATVRRYVARLCAQLRQHLPERNAVILRDGMVGLDPSLVWSDALHFYRLAATCRRHPSVDAFVALTDLYRGPLLCGFSLAGCREYEAWIQVARRLWARDYLAALYGLAKQAILAEDFSRAIVTAQRFLEITPLDEEMQRCLIGLYGLTGDLDAAAAQYQICADVLRRETGRPPQAATVETHRAATDGTLQRRRIKPSLSNQPFLLNRDLRRRQWQSESQPRRQKLLLL